MTIKYYTKHVYGVPMYYVVSPHYSQALRQLTGKKTIDKSNMKALEALGFTLQEVLESQLNDELAKELPL